MEIAQLKERHWYWDSYFSSAVCYLQGVEEDTEDTEGPYFEFFVLADCKRPRQKFTCIYASAELKDLIELPENKREYYNYLYGKEEALRG